MAKPDFTLVRGGQINQSGDDRALFLKVFGGEVFTAFEENNVFGDNSMVRTIASGKSAQFPSIGGKVAYYHTPGEMSVGTPGNLTETILTIDDFLESASSIAEIDQAMTHFDYRAPFSREDGRAIARAYDMNIARVGIQAAQTTTSRFAGTGDIYEAKTVGKIWDVANSDTDAAVLKGALVKAATEFDEKDVPETDRNAFFKPAQYHLLAADNDIVNRDFGAAGDVINLRVPRLAGFSLVKTNNLPTEDVTGTYGGGKYDVDARNTVALIMHPNAVGTLKVRDLSVGMTGNDYKVTHNATLVTSRMLVGHGVLRPELAQVIRTGAPV